MSILSMFLPIILIILVVGAAVSLNKYFKKIVTIKITHWLLLAYVIVLLVSSIFLPFTTDSKQAMDRVDEQIDEKEMNEFYEKIRKGQIEQIKDQYKVSEQTFDHDNSRPLHISSSSIEYGTPVYIEEKEVNDGKVDIFIYRSSLTINEMDFSEILKPYELEKDVNSIKIIAPNEKINISILSAAFPVRQMTGSSIISHSSGSSFGSIYIRIPRDVKVTNSEEIYLTYINKE